MKNLVVLILLMLLVAGVALFLWKGGGEAPALNQGEVAGEGQAPAPASDHKNAAYTIDGQVVQLKDGYAERDAAPDSASKVVTRYFGNELMTDLDGDGDEDVAFVLTQETGGTGIFYYAVAALQTEAGYVGSDGYLLGDRIAPQSTSHSPNPRQVRVVVFNYADRAPEEPMTARPSIGQSAYLKIVPEDRQWAIVEPDFEGESAL